MSIGKRIKFIARAYLNDLLDNDLTDKMGKTVRGMFDGEDDPAGAYEDIDLDELEKKFADEFADLHRSAGGPRARRRPRPRRKADKLEEHYKTLGLKPGADFKQVRTQFRTLMRKYHPDRFAGDARKQAAATKKSQAISEAFAALEKALDT